MVNIKFSRENDSVLLPTKREEDAGYDLYLDTEWLREKHGGILRVKPLETVMLPTGLRSCFPKEYYAQLQERGSTGTKGMKYGAGVIDSGFTGVWNVVITNCGEKDIIFYDVEDKDIHVDMIDNYYPSNKGVAQFVLLPVPKTKIEEVSKETILSKDSERGESMLGASGK